MHQDISPYSSLMNTNPQFPEHEHLNCPRCDSSNTKFCYYNNYNLLQPRHFCKNCRRYWTKGGTLRKIPIGGGTRKTTKRSPTSNKRPATSTVTTPPPPPPPVQLNPERSAIFDFSQDRGKTFNLLFRSKNQAQIGSVLDDLKTELNGGSEDDGLNKTPVMDVFRRNYLSVDNDHNHGGKGESSGCDGRGNGWPDLSISGSGSNFG